MAPEDRADAFILTLLTADPVWVRAAAKAGVQRIGVDIERRGKRARQRHLHDARISAHRLADLRQVTPNAGAAKVFARLNPLHAGTGDEIERAVDFGASLLMLPQFRTRRQAGRFVDLVAGRTEVLLLVETPEAATSIREIAALGGVDEIMIGLNDLHHALGLRTAMELAGSSLLGELAAAVRAAGVRFGFGGLARPGLTALPLAPDLLLARHAALGSGSAWVARSFFHGGLEPLEFPDAVRALRARLAWWFGRPSRALSVAQSELSAAISNASA